jgi:hypothetical protein
MHSLRELFAVVNPMIFKLFLLLQLAWISPGGLNDPMVTSPPEVLNLPAFYSKYISANGYPIVASSQVNDYALKEAAFLVNQLLANRPDVRDAMIQSGSRMSILAMNTSPKESSLGSTTIGRTTTITTTSTLAMS